MTDYRENENRDLPIPADYSFGDHGPFAAKVEFKASWKYDGRQLRGSMAYVVVRCEQCCWSSRANHFKSANPTEPNAFFKEKLVDRVLLQAFNNFKDKAPASCADALASFVLTS